MFIFTRRMNDTKRTTRRLTTNCQHHSRRGGGRPQCLRSQSNEGETGKYLAEGRPPAAPFTAYRGTPLGHLTDSNAGAEMAGNRLGHSRPRRLTRGGGRPAETVSSSAGNGLRRAPRGLEGVCFGRRRQLLTE